MKDLTLIVWADSITWELAGQGRFSILRPSFAFWSTEAAKEALPGSNAAKPGLIQGVWKKIWGIFDSASTFQTLFPGGWDSFHSLSLALASTLFASLASTQLFG